MKLVGEGTFVFDLIDAETGVYVARINERRKIRRAKGSSGPADAAMLWKDVRSWARQAASDLYDELERVRRHEAGLRSDT